MARKEDRIAFNERLISEVERRVPIWDVKHPDYKDSKLLTALWQEIAVTLDLSVKDVTERWRNLRDTFVRLLRKIKGAKNGNEVPIVRWPYFKQLLFLRPSVSHRSLNRKIANDNEEISRLAAAVIMDNDRQISDEDEFNSFQDTSLDIHSHLQLQLQEENSSSSECSLEKRAKRKRCSSSYLDDESLKSFSNVNKILKREHDDVEMFLLSLAPHLRKVPTHLYGLCQMNMLQVAVSFSAGIIPSNLCNPFS